MSEMYVIVRNISLREFNTMRIDAKADKLIIPYSTEGACKAIYDYYDQQPLFLGNGSNTIFSQECYSHPIICSVMLRDINWGNHTIISGAGVSLSSLSWFALEKSLSGYEFLEDIPGSVGGALYMNAGTYEDTIGDRVVSVIIYDYIDNKVKELTKEELMPWWGKRNSYFQHHPCFIIQVEFEASNIGNYEEILEKMLETKKKRYMKQPRNYPSAGSVFKRPYVNGEPKYIWKLLDEVGLRGYRIGGAQVSEKHPGFIVNVGNATGKDVVDLMNYCKQAVWDKYGIKIEEEWRIV